MNKLKILTITIIILMAAILALPRALTAEAAPPDNDDFYSAILITGLPFTSTVDTREATNGWNDPWPCGNYPFNSVWYSYTPTTNAPVQISTGNSSYTRAVGVYTGDYNGGLSEVMCNTNAPSLTVYLNAGVTYSIMVVATTTYPYPGPGGYGGDLQIAVTELPPPPNDDFDNAKLITDLPYSDSMDTSLATWASDDPTGCWHNSGSVWYAYTPSTNMTIEANTFGSYYDTTLAVYTGTRGALEVVPNCCNDDYNGLQSLVSFQATANTTYYFLVGRCCGQGGNGGGPLVFNVIAQLPPANDSFANAVLVDQLPFYFNGNNQYATTEAQEPVPSCSSGEQTRTVWFSYTPTENGSMMLETSGFFYQFEAIYVGNGLGQLTEIGCKNYTYYPQAFQVEAGKTYYFQLGSMYSWDYGAYEFRLNWTPPPVAGFWWSPTDPNRYDQVMFCDSSYDPAGVGIPGWLITWNFGDGATATGYCVYHNYPKDGTYTLQHTVETYDGRKDSESLTFIVRTHDVAITKFLTPQAASPGQTRQITIGIRNNDYPENAEVYLMKGTAYGFQTIQAARLTIPVYKSNRTTDVKFDYTFTDQDAITGKVSFKAVVYIYSARDAIQSDNEAIGKPTKINSTNKPYYAALLERPGAAPAFATFGFLSLGVLLGFLLVKPHPKPHRGRRNI